MFKENKGSKTLSRSSTFST